VIQGAMRAIQGIIEIVLGIISGNWKMVWQGIKDFFGGIWGAIWSVLSGLGKIGEHLWDWLTAGLKFAVNGVIHGINWMVDRINDLTHTLSDIWSWAGVPAIPSIPHIPYLAAGGLVTQGGMAVVGDAGAEVVQLPTGSAVYPHGSAPAGAGGGSSVVLDVQPGGSGLDRLFVQWLKEAVRKRGGNPGVLGP
jgi:phage-related protein